MPSVISETDTFAATVSRPNNGELADAGSISLYETADASRDRYLYNRGLTSMLFDVKRAGFGALGNATADDAPAIQLAINAASAIGGGVVVLSPGAYKLNSGLTLYKGVSLVGVPGHTVLTINHATAHTITLSTGTYSGHPQVISGIGFEGTVANTGYVIYDAGSQVRGVKIIDCSVNYASANLQGTFFRSDGNAGSSYVLENVNARLVGAGVFVSHVVGGDLVIRGGKVALPVTAWAADAIYVGANVRARITGVRFDMTLATAGGGRVINASSSLSALVIADCIFEDAASGINPIMWITGARITTAALQFINCNNYLSLGQTAVGSVIELFPFSLATTTAASYTIPDNYKSFLLRTNSDTVIRLPNGLFPGQEFQLSVYNYNGASTIAPSLAVTPVTGNTVPTVVSLKTMTGTFLWQDRDASGSYRWIQQGLWCFNGSTIV